LLLGQVSGVNLAGCDFLRGRPDEFRPSAVDELGPGGVLDPALVVAVLHCALDFGLVELDLDEAPDLALEVEVEQEE